MWLHEDKNPSGRRYEIKHVPPVGYYVYVTENGRCVADHLQDTLDWAKKSIQEDYGVPEDAWLEVS